MCRRLGILCALTLLPCLPACGWGANAPEVDPSIVDPIDSFRATLRQRVSVDWNEVPLSQALADLSERCGVAIHFDQAKLEAALGLPLDEPVSLRAKDIRLESALGLLLGEYRLTYTGHWEGARIDGIQVINLLNVPTSLLTRIYHVADITRSQDSLTEEALAKVVHQFVEPDAYYGRKDVGTIEARPGALWVQHALAVHLQIDNILEQLRDLAQRDERSPSQRWTASEAAVYKALESPVTLDLTRPPSDVLREVAERHGINVVISRRGIDDVYATTAVESPSAIHADAPPLVDVPLGEALDYLLEPLNCGWIVEHDVLLVTSRHHAMNTCLTRTYRLEPEHLHVDRDKWRSNEFTDALIELVSPEAWRQTGGPGDGALVPGGWLVKQTPHLHREIDRLLAQVHRAKDPRVVDYDERDTGPGAKRWREALDRPVTVDLNGSLDLVQAIKDLQARHALPSLFIDRRRIGWEKIDLESLRPNFRVSNISLASALSLLLGPARLGWYVEGEVLVVTSADHVNSKPLNFVYRWIDPWGGAETERMPHAMVRWQQAAGGATFEAFPPAVVVSDFASGHHVVRRFLQQWDMASEPERAGPVIAVTPAEQRLLQALRRPVTYSCEARPWLTVLRELAEAGGVENFVVHWPMQDHPQLLDAASFSVRAKDEPLADVLARLPRPEGWEWAACNEVLLVARQGNHSVVPGIYALSGKALVTLKQAMGNKPNDPPSLFKNVLWHLLATCAPEEAWDLRLGMSVYTVPSPEKPLRFVLTHTLAAHSRVERFLEAFNKDGRLPPELRDDIATSAARLREQYKQRQTGGGFFSVPSAIPPGSNKEVKR